MRPSPFVSIEVNVPLPLMVSLLELPLLLAPCVPAGVWLCAGLLPRVEFGLALSWPGLVEDGVLGVLGVVALCASAMPADDNAATAVAMRMLRFLCAPDFEWSAWTPKEQASHVPAPAPVRSRAGRSWGALAPGSPCKEVPVLPEFARARRVSNYTHAGMVSESMVGRVGLEPTTNALKGRCSTS
jgi:hypothetical protein